MALHVEEIKENGTTFSDPDQPTGIGLFPFFIPFPSSQLKVHVSEEN